MVCLSVQSRLHLLLCYDLIIAKAKRIILKKLNCALTKSHYVILHYIALYRTLPQRVGILAVFGRGVPLGSPNPDPTSDWAFIIYTTNISCP